MQTKLAGLREQLNRRNPTAPPESQEDVDMLLAALETVTAALRRVERKADEALEQLQILAASLADDYSDEDEDSPLQLTLDGEPLFRDREEGLPL